jgi:dihydrofolate synthase/folylpolyglutamate synthase
MSEYSQALSELYDLQQFAIKLGLDNIRALEEEMGNPHLTYPVIHIAGTNGKGSTAWFTAKILEGMGLKTGLFTSPHLVRFNERIQINGNQISDEAMVEYWQKIKKLVLDRKATFFDTTTALALDHFRNEQVDVAIIETGLGGRLDSTNIVQPEIVAITPIQIDHEKQLGDRLEQIAVEKAGIIKTDSTVFCARQSEEAFVVIKEKANITEKFYYLPDCAETNLTSHSLEGLDFDLKDKLREEVLKNVQSLQTGEFQLQNIAMAYIISREYIAKKNIVFDRDKLRSVLKSSMWPGRLQVIRRHPDILFDVSHNADGISHTIDTFMKIKNNGRLITLIGLVQDKDFKRIAGMISKISDYIFVTEPDTHRKLDGEILSSAFRELSASPVFIKDFQGAFETAKGVLGTNDTLLVIGSHYLIGSLLKNENNLT